MRLELVVTGRETSKELNEMANDKAQEFMDYVYSLDTMPQIDNAIRFVKMLAYNLQGMAIVNQTMNMGKDDMKVVREMSKLMVSDDAVHVCGFIDHLLDNVDSFEKKEVKD